MRLILRYENDRKICEEKEKKIVDAKKERKE
jgi:hypothetical protein